MSTAPNAPIRTAVIGFGTSGRVFHAPFVDTNPEFSLDVIVTANPDRVAEANRLHPEARVVATPDEALAAGVDLIVIGSPPATHVDLAGRALDAGAHVVVDKPFVVASADGRALIERAEGAGRLLTVFQNRRWDGDYLTLRQLIDDGALGEVRRFESRFEGWKPVPRVAWKAESPASEGGGILFDLGAHLIDQALRLFGPVNEVYAEVRSLRPGAAADDDAFVALEHASGTISHLWMSSMAPRSGPRFHVLGSEAGWTSWGLDPQEDALKGGASPTDPGFGDKPEEDWGMLGLGPAAAPYPTLRGDYAAFYRALADSILRGGPLPVDPRDSVEVLEMIEAIHEL